MSKFRSSMSEMEGHSQQLCTCVVPIFFERVKQVG
uniref:Uncharacterized protein n=1 Tax=Anguilla anguilla TaxID=7936 RepID=A0A0E9V9G3_ANGAN